MVWLINSRILRKPVTLMGAACTSMIVGVFIFNRVLSSDHRVCDVASCSSASKSPSYERLQKNEASKKLKHPFVKKVDVNFLGSNTPIEDRFVVGASSNLGAAMFSVIDGHKGYHCSHHLQNHLLQHLSSHLHSVLESSLRNDVAIVMDMNSTTRFLEGYTVEEFQSNPFANVESSAIKECLKKSYLSLDSDISNAGLEAVKAVMQGHSLSDDIKQCIRTAIDGACVITAMVTPEELYVASTGDCRVVLGQKLPNNTWKALPLSVDQNAQNPVEVERLFQSHPGEEDTVIVANRVLGSLMPFRTFGDVDFKWDEKHLRSVVPYVWPNYLTPPYITAEPVITDHKLRADTDKFMILASDGLWERMSNEEAVNIVAETIKTKQPPSTSFFSFFSGKSSKEECCTEVENAATKLLWHALGGTEDGVRELLDVSPQYSRMFRDDITILVVFFESSV